MNSYLKTYKALILPKIQVFGRRAIFAMLEKKSSVRNLKRKIHNKLDDI
jgi:hypothetical protein